MKSRPLQNWTSPAAARTGRPSRPPPRGAQTRFLSTGGGDSAPRPRRGSEDKQAPHADHQRPPHCCGGGGGLSDLQGTVGTSESGSDGKTGRGRNFATHTAILILRGRLPREACPDASTLGFPRPGPPATLGTTPGPETRVYQAVPPPGGDSGGQVSEHRRSLRWGQEGVARPTIPKSPAPRLLPEAFAQPR